MRKEQENKKVWGSIVQFIKFCLVGVSNTVISYLVNVVTIFLFDLLDFSFDYIFGNLAGFFVGTLWAFWLNSRHVFVVDRGANKMKMLLKMYVTYAFSGIVINNLSSIVLIHFFGVSKYFAPIINLIITVPFNFILSKIWIFKKR